MLIGYPTTWARRSGAVAALVVFVAMAACGDKEKAGARPAEHAKSGDGHAEHGDEKGHDEKGGGEKGGGEKGHDEKGHDEKGHDEKGGGEKGRGGEHHGDDEVTLTPEAAANIDIKTVIVARRTMSGELVTTGSVGYDEARVSHVSPLVTGRVSRVIGKLGDMVKPGDTVAVVRSIELGRAKARYLQNKAQLELARQTYQREKVLSAQKISSEQTMLVAKSAFLQAQAVMRASAQTLRLYGISKRSIAKLSYDSNALALHWVHAPLGGKIVKKHVAVGEQVTPARTLFTIADLRTVWIWIDVYERDLRRVHLEDVAYVRPNAFPGLVIKGKVTYIRDEVDVDSRTIRARISVPNKNGALRPGMFVRVRLADPHRVKGKKMGAHLVVPTLAVQRVGDDKHVVFVKEGERTYERRDVKLGKSSGDLTEIESGVKEGEQVVTHGGFLLKSEVSKKSMGGGHSH